MMKRVIWAAVALAWVCLYNASYSASPLVISFSQDAPSLVDNSPAGTVLTTVTVKYSDGTTPSSISLTSGDPSFAAISGMNVVLARDLTPADDGVHNISITANALVFSAPVEVQITITTPGAAVPVGVTLTPSSVSELATATAGTVLATASVAMSDNSSFAGSLLSSNPALVGVSGLNVVLARDLASNDVGFYNITIAAQP